MSFDPNSKKYKVKPLKFSRWYPTKSEVAYVEGTYADMAPSFTGELKKFNNRIEESVLDHSIRKLLHTLIMKEWVKDKFSRAILNRWGSGEYDVFKKLDYFGNSKMVEIAKRMHK